MSVANVEWIGWLSSFVLIATIGKQVHKQWTENTSEGVSKWLFLGQLAAGIGFIAYSAALRNWVFLVTNVVLVIGNILGFLLVLSHRRRESSQKLKLELQPKPAEA